MNVKLNINKKDLKYYIKIPFKDKEYNDKGLCVYLYMNNYRESV